MDKRLNHPGNLRIAGLLSAIFFCLVVALGGSGGSWRVATPDVVPSIPYSGETDVSHRPSTLFLVNPNRQAVVSASKSDKGLGLDHGGAPHPAIAPDEITLPEYLSEKQFATAVQQALNGTETSGYNARAPPTLI